MSLAIGDSASRSRTISAADVAAFADVADDHNPVHLDDDYAAGTPFGKRIAHGMLVASLISAVLANDLPGAGSVYMSQSIKFKKPVFIGDTITATVTVTAYRASRRIATLETIVTNQEGVVVLEGEAMVIAPDA